MVSTFSPRGSPNAEPVPTPTQPTENENVQRAIGNTLLQEKYDFNYSVFPMDLGMDDNAHYMVININVPTEIPINLSSVSAAQQSIANIRNGNAFDGLALRTPAGAFRNKFTEINNVSKLDTLRFGTTNLPGVQRPLATIPRYTRRIAESIALHMPTPLIFNQHNIYEEISLTALAGKVGVGILSGTGQFVADLIGSRFLGGLANIVDPVAQTITAASSLMQRPINPAVEVLFANTPQRQFTFEVLMAPRNEKESETVRRIVATMRFHGSPEYSDALINGLFWIPPADFDITFFHKGKENFNILRINTCVLERIEIDYAPSGIYSTFRNGHPVAVRMSLGFRELEPVHKQRVLQGF